MHKWKAAAAVAGIGAAMFAGVGTASAAPQGQLLAEAHCSNGLWCSTGYFTSGGAPLVIEFDASGGDNVGIYADIAHGNCITYRTTVDAPINWVCPSPGPNDMWAQVSLEDTRNAARSMYIKIYRG
ncbi:hypothetical protein [Amycolatopsis magusensis]|uniref:hypothetical protein n=1 Tax=Amycolatopsis magusensis TaxID=882444 RepID=UPI003C2B22FC